MTVSLFRPSTAMLLAIIAVSVAPVMAQTVPDAALSAEGSRAANGSLPATGANGVSTPPVFVSAIADGAVSAPSLGQSEAEVATAKAEAQAAAEAAVAEAEAAAKAAAEGGVAEDGSADGAPNEPVVTEDGSIALVPGDVTEPQSPFLRIGAEAAPVAPGEVPAAEPPFEPVPIVE